jgi:AraC-like DNA-binding protein
MDQTLLEKLKEITAEEQALLDGQKKIEKGLYLAEGNLREAPEAENFVIDAGRLMEKGRLIEIRPHTRFAHFPPHRHNYVELVYMAAGSTTHILNETDRLVLEEGDLLFLNQYATQEILPAGADDIAINFIILPAFFEQAISMMGTDNLLRGFLLSALSCANAAVSYLHFHAGDILPVRNLMENMIWNLVMRKSQTNVLNQTTMGLALMNLSAFATEINSGQPSGYEQQLLFASLKYIETHYRDGSLQELCRTLGEPDYYLSRLLKKQTGHTFRELLQKRKLEQAAYLLSNTTLTTARIMEAIGYDNSSYFHRLFRAQYGVSPKKYRS